MLIDAIPPEAALVALVIVAVLTGLALIVTAILVLAARERIRAGLKRGRDRSRGRLAGNTDPKGLPHD